jgi:hypothetical protein
MWSKATQRPWITSQSRSDHRPKSRPNSRASQRYTERSLASCTKVSLRGGSGKGRKYRIAYAVQHCLWNKVRTTYVDNRFRISHFFISKGNTYEYGRMELKKLWYMLEETLNIFFALKYRIVFLNVFILWLRMCSVSRWDLEIFQQPPPADSKKQLRHKKRCPTGTEQ